jgi:hypothetical protein
VIASVKLVAFYTIMYGKIMAFLSNKSLCEYLLQSVQPFGIKGRGRDIAVRESLAKYFISTQRSIPWQYGKMYHLFFVSKDISFMEIN